jgi:integrase
LGFIRLISLEGEKPTYMVKDFLDSLASPKTRKSYAHGLKVFEEFYGKPAKALLKAKDPGKVIEKFYVWCLGRYMQNSCRAVVNPIIQYCKYNGVEPKIRKSLRIYHTVPTTRDHILTVDETREMYKVGSLEEKVMVKIWLLGLRIEDACMLEWKKFDIYQVLDEPKEVLIHTKKENVVADVFIDKELQQLLVKYIPTLDKDNPYLFQSARRGHLTEKQLLRNLQNLRKRAGVEATGIFGWHIGRKLFLRICAENGINTWSANMMVGKAVDSSIATYIRGANLRREARKVLNVLCMEPLHIAGTPVATALDLVMKVMRKMIEREMQASGVYNSTLGFLVEKSDEEVLREYVES